MAEARFCRSCGAPLKSANLHESEAPISPLAQTVPLSNEGRSTDGLAPNDPRRARSDTGKVGQAEIESLLRRSRAKQAGDGDGSKGAVDAIDLPAAQTTMLASDSIASQVMPENQSSRAAPEAAPSATAQPNVRSRRMWQAAAVVLLCVALVAGVLAFILSRRSNLADAGNTSPISISDQQQLVNEKLAEADILLDAGEFSRAITILRSAVKLDPSSVEAHMRLGHALEKTGERDEAIDEYRAATQASPKNVSAWRALASAQVAEKLYGEAADSYRHLIETAGEGSVDDETRLAYADALRLAGRTDEARLAYQKISVSNTETIAREARARLVELGPPAVAANNDPKRAMPREGEEERAPDAGAASSPSPQPSPPARVTPTPAQTNADSYYFMAVNMVNGRDPRSLSDGELAAALNYFLLAQRGNHGAEAKRNADRLGKEYDRRKKKG